MGLRTASVRRRSSLTMAPALTETKTTNSFKLTPKTSSTALDIDAVLDDSIAATATSTNQTAIVRKGVKGDNNTFLDAAFDLSHLQLAAELLNGDLTLDRCKQTSIDNGMMNSAESSISTNAINMGLQQQKDNPEQQQQQQLEPLLHLKDEKMEGQIVDQMFGDLHTDDDLMQQVIQSIESSVGVAEELPLQLPLTASDLATLPGNLSSLEKALFNAVDMMVEEQLMDNATTTQDSKDLRTKELIAQVQGKQVHLERKLDFLVRRLRKMQMRFMGQHLSAEVGGVYEHVHRTLRRLKDQGNQQQTNNTSNGSSTATASFDSSGAASAALDLSVSAHKESQMRLDEQGEVLKPISHNAAKSLVKKLENTRYLQANSAARQRHSARFFGSGSIEPASFRTTTTTPSSSVTMTTLPTWSALDKTSLQQTAGQLRAQISLIQGQLDSDATLSSSGGESCDEMQTYGNVHQQYLAIQKRAAWKYSSGRASIAARWSWLLAQIADLEYRIRQHTDLQRVMRAQKGPVILNSFIPTPCNSATGQQQTAAVNAAVNGYKGTLPGSTIDAAAAATVTTDNVSQFPTSTSDYQQQQTANSPCLNNSTSSGSTTSSSPASVQSTTCARIRPLNTAAFTKRRLVQTGGLHVISKKAARPATVRCACVADIVSSCAGTTLTMGGSTRGMNCAVCTGRSDPTHPRDPTEHLSRMERIALLDGGYHPVVSLPEDTSISIHMEAIMKSVDWQQRSSRSSLKAMKYAIKADRTNNSDRNSEKQQQQQQQQSSGGGGTGEVGQQRATSGKKGGGLEHRKKYNRMSGSGSGIKGSTVNALAAKLKTGKPRGRKPNRHNNNSLSIPPTATSTKKHRRHSNHHQRNKDSSYLSYSTSSRRESNDDIDDDEYNMLDEEYMRGEPLGDQYLVGGGLGGSRSGSPLLATQSISGFGRRNRVDSYDIDNIVIPYSVAASTRVERLQYKEILTPKWRLIDNSNLPPIKYESKNNGVVKITSQEYEVSEVEDITEDSVQQRHDKSEQEEKRKFLSYLKLPFGYYGNNAHSSARRHHQQQQQQQQQSLHHNHKRTDSRAESSGANTPDNPMSPAAATGITAVQLLGDTSTAAGETPVASPPPLDQLINKGEELPESLRNLPLSSLSSLRRRTISASSSRWLQRDLSNDSSTVDQQQQLAPIVEIPPFDRRQFPLSEENFDKMVRGMPEGHHKGTANQPQMNVRNQDSCLENTGAASGSSTVVTSNNPHHSTPVNTKTATDSQQGQQQSRRRRSNNLQQQQQQTPQQQQQFSVVSHHGDDIDSESTESAFGDEDPNDPEWDMEDQITCGARNSHHHHHNEIGRFRR